MLTKLLKKHVRQGTLTLVAPDGTRQTFGDGSPRVTWRIRTPRTMLKILVNPEANLGETYMNEEWDVEEGELVDLLTILRTNLESAVAGRSVTALLAPAATVFKSWNTVRASLHNVSHHYNLDEALFRAFLDQNMHYSCAYFCEDDMTLEAAQVAKSEHIRNKLCLKPGARVLDIGSGWGSLAMHLAVLHRHCGVAMADQDVFANVVGGVRINETGADLALMAAVMSSFRARALPRDLVAFGEIGLTGEVRPAPNGQERLREARKHGFTRAICPRANRPRQPIDGIEVHAVATLAEALDILREP